MALTLSQIFRGKFEDKFITGYNVTFDSSYAAGGEAIAANQVGMANIDVILTSGSIGGRLVVWDSTAATLKTFVSGSSGGVLAETTAGTDLSLVTFPIVVIGI